MEPEFDPAVKEYTAYFAQRANARNLGFSVQAESDTYGMITCFVDGSRVGLGDLNRVSLAGVSIGEYVEKTVTLNVTDGKTTETYTVAVRVVRDE